MNPCYPMDNWLSRPAPYRAWLPPQLLVWFYVWYWCFLLCVLFLCFVYFFLCGLVFGGRVFRWTSPGHCAGCSIAGSALQPCKRRVFGLPLLPSGPDGVRLIKTRRKSLRTGVCCHRPCRTRLRRRHWGQHCGGDAARLTSASAWRRFQITGNAWLPGLVRHLFSCVFPFYLYLFC